MLVFTLGCFLILISILLKMSWLSVALTILGLTMVVKSLSIRYNDPTIDKLSNHVFEIVFSLCLCFIAVTYFINNIWVLIPIGLATIISLATRVYRITKLIKQ